MSRGATVPSGNPLDSSLPIWGTPEINKSRTTNVQHHSNRVRNRSGQLVILHIPSSQVCRAQQKSSRIQDYSSFGLDRQFDKLTGTGPNKELLNTISELFHNSDTCNFVDSVGTAHVWFVVSQFIFWL
ncbi:hypothetical protein GQ457_01G056190 [Hibiscus cannabinus]